MKKKILFITGSVNQTSQMHQISKHLLDFDCHFSQIFADSPVINFLVKYTSLVDGTILAGQFKRNSEKYLRQNNLKIDYKAEQNVYDLVVYCSDLIIPDRLLRIKTLWIQEGMTDLKTWKSRLTKALNLPPYFSGDTSLNGSNNICDVYCAASEGYKRYFTEGGTAEEKIFVTGMPNYDNAQEFLNNDFPHHDYVMVATTDMRETFRPENRVAFIQEAVRKAKGQRMLFKLHPNEIVERAVVEIKANTPEDTLIYWGGNTSHMIANCRELITQFSTVVYIGLALGKKVHSYFDVDTLRSLAPIQNNGTSAQNIAHICRNFAHFEGKKADFAKQFEYATCEENEWDFLLNNLKIKKTKKGKNTEGVEELENV